MKDTTGRIEWVDIAKVLGIFLVVLGHHKINSNVILWIFSFHMPLFFFISGILFDPSKYPVFNDFLAKKIRTLIVPYFFFAVFSYLFWLVIVRSLSIHGESLSMDPIKPFIGIFYGIGVNGWAIPLDTALWFLPCLFITEILMWLINSYFKNEQIVFALAGFAFLGFLINLLGLPRFPWSMDVSLVASVFYGTGFLCKDLVGKWMSHKYFLFSIGAFLALNLCVGFLNGRVDMNENHYGNIVLFYLSAIAGIFFLIGVSMLMTTNKLINYVGQNTLIIMGLNGIAFFILGGFIYLLKGSLPITSEVPVINALVYSILQILLLLPVIFIINKFLPFIIGRRRAGY